MKSRTQIIIVLLILLTFYFWWETREISHGVGVVAADSPQQYALTEAVVFEHMGYQITAVATFNITARVLKKKNYSAGKAADLLPIDFAFGWGRMSDEKILKHINIFQAKRFYFWSVKQFPIPKQEIVTSSANMHLIAANEEIAEQLSALLVGNVVHIRGKLVNIKTSDNWFLNTSLSRADSGAGACEIIWVEDISVKL